MDFKKGEIVLYDSGSDVIVAFISSVMRERGENEVKVIIRVDKIATLSKGLIAGKIGELEEKYMNEVSAKRSRLGNEKIKNMFGL